MTARPLVSLLIGLAVATFLGAICATYDIPLGWILGAIAGGALVSNLLGPPAVSTGVRRVSQLLIGAAAAAVMTPDVLTAMVGLLPAMIGAAVLANLAGAALIWPFMKLTGVDRTTAALSVLPAGMAEMSALAEDLGARTDVVVVVHTLRVLLVVVSIPFLLNLSIATQSSPPVPPTGSYAALFACIAFGAAAAYSASRVGILNPWILMPMVTGVVLVALGLTLMPLPNLLLIAAQIGIGYALGTRIKSADLVHLPIIAASAVLTGIALIAVMLFLVSPILPTGSAVDSRSLSLGVAPGGLGEMIATSKAIGGATAIVAGFQFVRSFLTNMLVPPILVRLLGKV